MTPLYPIIVLLFTCFTLPFVDHFSKKRLTYPYLVLMFLASVFSVVSMHSQAAEPLVLWIGGWTPAETYYGIAYAVDSFSWLFGILVVLVGFCVVFCSREKVVEKGAGHAMLLCLLCTGYLGTVFTADFFNLFVFLEIASISAIGLIATGNDERGYEAAFKYLVISSLASFMMLFAIILVYASTGTLTIAHVALNISQNYVALLAFALFFVAFCVEAVLVPVHWLADALSGAPAFINVLLSAVGEAVGAYVLLRIVFVVFDFSMVSSFLVLIGLVTMFVGVSQALVQKHLKRVLVFSSVSEMGFVVFSLGLNSVLGLVAGVFHLVNHALAKGALFLAAGSVWDAVGTDDLDELSGLAKKMPEVSAFFVLAALALSGVPPLNGFASKWLIYNAAASNPLLAALVFLASVSTLAVYIRVFQKSFLGGEKSEKIVPVSRSVVLCLAFLCTYCVLLGLFPEQFLEKLVVPAVEALTGVNEYVLGVLA